MRKPVAGSKDEEFDAGSELVGYGFQGLKVTMNELEDLAKELGLDEKDAKEFARGLQDDEENPLVVKKETKEDTPSKAKTP